MPVLPAELFVYPEDLFSGPLESDGDRKRWWALHTRPRAEKALARRLVSQRISFFLPHYERRRRLQRRLVRALLPLFPGYLFLRTSDEGRRKALETNLVAASLHIQEQEQTSAELAKIFRLIVSGAPLSPEARLRPGMRAEITAGPLCGLQGNVIRRGKALRFVIEVDFLQRGASVEIDASMIQPV